jgi:cadmium resistance protein CadD (predicted permease)
MKAIVLLSGLGAAAFAATDIDDIFVLVGFFADPEFRTRHVVIGQYLGIGVLVAVSVAASLISLVIPPVYVGLLGLVPIAIGARGLWNQSLGQEISEEDLEAHATPRGHKILTVSAVSIANGGDNIATYTPLFAAHRSYELAILVCVFAAMTAVWCLAACWLVRHRTLGAPIRRHGHRVLPFVLLGLGVLILYEAGTFTLLQSAA